MQEMFIGEIIKEKRNELGLTQADLCEGICEPITISRLERNKQTPSRNIVRALLQRLGLPDDRYFAVVTGKEIQLNKLHNEIVAYNVQFDKANENEKKIIRKNALKAFSELEKIIDKDDTISLQLLERSRVIIGTDERVYTYSEKIALLESALKITQPRFKMDKISNGYYSVEEVKIINHIALLYSADGKHSKAISIWEQLIEYHKKYNNIIITVIAQKSLILTGYSRELAVIGDFEKAIEYAQQGIDICIKYEIFHNLSALLMILAECKFKTGITDESKQLFTESYYLCKVVKDDINRTIARDSLKEYFQVIID